MARKIPDRLLIHAAKLIQEGSRLKDAATVIGFTADMVSQSLKASGYHIPIGRRKGASGPIPKAITSIPEDIQIAIAKGYTFGKGTPTLRDEFGVSRSSILKILKRRNVPLRDPTEANRLMMSARTTEQNTQNTKNARLRRAKNLSEDAVDSVPNRSIGFGEAEFAEILRQRGMEFRQQVRIDDYILDFVIGNVTVEVKTSAVSAHITTEKTRARFKKIVESGYRFVYLVVNSVDVLTRYATYVIAGINRAGREDSSIGQYWMIECRLEQIGSHLEVDRFTIERRTPKPFDTNKSKIGLH